VYPAGACYRLNPISVRLVDQAYAEQRVRVLQTAAPSGTLPDEHPFCIKWLAHCHLWGTASLRGFLPAYI